MGENMPSITQDQYGRDIEKYPTNPPEVEILDGPSYEGGIDDGGPHHTYKLALTYDGRAMSTPWRQGLGITDEPGIGSVMSCLISDAVSVENSTGFPDWAEDLGFNPDSISDRKIWEAVKTQTYELERVLGRRILVALMDDEDSTYGSDERFLAAWERAMAQVAS